LLEGGGRNKSDVGEGKGESLQKREKKKPTTEKKGASISLEKKGENIYLIAVKKGRGGSLFRQGGSGVYPST